jgi:hypothetical protein
MKPKVYERILKALSQHINDSGDEEPLFFSQSVNPIKTAMHLLSILETIKGNCPESQLRID